MLNAGPYWLRQLFLTFLAVSCPSSFTGYGGMGGAAEGVGTGVSDVAVAYFLWSVFFGGALGYFYSRFPRLIVVPAAGARFSGVVCEIDRNHWTQPTARLRSELGADLK